MLPLKIKPNITIKANEIKIKAIRAQGPGGQNVNKVASAIQLSFNIATSTLPESYKRRLFKLSNLSQGNTIIFKSQNYRSQERNLHTAYERLRSWILDNTAPVKPRLKTKIKKSAIEKRLKNKKHRSNLKLTRNKYLGE